MQHAIKEVFAANDLSWRGLLSESQRHIAALRAMPPAALNVSISGHEGERVDDLKHHATVLQDFLGKRGGKLGLRMFLHPQVRASVDKLGSVRIDGAPCTTSEPLAILQLWTEAIRLLRTLEQEWGPYFEAPRGTIRGMVDRYEDACKTLDEIISLFELSKSLSRGMHSLFNDRGPSWDEEAQVQEYVQAFSALIEIESLRPQLDEALQQLKELEVASRSLVSAVRSSGLQAAIAGRDVEGYRSLQGDIEREWTDWRRRTRASESLARLDAECPELASLLKSAPTDPSWQILLNSWEECCAWAIARSWVERMAAPDAWRMAEARVKDLQENIRTSLVRLAETRAWGHCFKRLSEDQRMHLQAWAQAVRRVGKGTGKYAPMHRKAARDHIAYCTAAIPGWIMPIYRVAESIQ
ncbi:MAG: hypothetical protein ACREP9_07610, partial [Candidatus Dormibacteraceae bacterium]